MSSAERFAWILVFLGLPFACREQHVPEALPTAVRVQAIDEESLAQATRYSAQILPSKRVDVAFKVGGYVAAIAKVSAVEGGTRPLQAGDPVVTGQYLVSLRQTDYNQKVEELAAAMAQAKAAATQAELDFSRASKLAERGTIAPADLDSARLSRDSSKAALQMSDSRFEQARTALHDTSLRSPIDGVVVARNVEEGSLVAPGMVAFSVAAIGTVKAAFGVPDTALSRIQLGSEQTVTTEAYPGEEFRGRITRVSPTADANGRVFEVEITLPNEDQRLKVGMIAALSLSDTDAEVADVLHRVVPISAIVRSPHNAENYAVFVVEDVDGKAVARARDVVLGEYLGNVIPVVQGLTGSERVVVQGAGLLSDGEAVEIIP
jgi:multidrug efflux system membrane fusion protein